jgi:flagellin
MLNVSSPIDFRTRIQRATENVTKSAEKASSGLRINRAADDAAGLGISESLRTQVRGLHQAVSNIEQGINVVQIGEEGVQNSMDVLQRLRELVIQASNGTNAPNDLTAIQSEIDQLKKTVLGAFETANRFRETLEGPTAAQRVLDFQVGANQGDTIRVDYNNLRTALIDFIVPAYGFAELAADPASARFASGQFGSPLPAPNAPVPPPPLFPPFPPGTTFQQAFPKILLVDPNTQLNIQNSMDLIDNALRNLGEEGAYLGASHNQLEYSLNQVMTGKENMASAESQIRDTDMAAQATATTKAQILQSSAMEAIKLGADKQSAIVTLLRGLQ